MIFEEEPAALATARRAGARATLLKQITEQQWHGYVVSFATLHQWSSYHTYDSRRSNAGFPDLVLVRDAYVVFAELKAEDGRVTAAQQRWIDELSVASAASGGALAAYIWRPSDRDAVEKVLG